MLSKSKIIFLLLVGVLSIISINVNASLSKKNRVVTTQTQFYDLRYPNQVNQLLREINPQSMWNNLSTLTNYPDRSAVHESGVDAAYWIKNQVETTIKSSGRHDVNIYTVDTKGIDPFGNPIEYKQPSIILKIGESNEPGIVLGAHLDTVGCDNEGCKNDPYGLDPGADDDGSGTVTVLETARTLLLSDMRFKKPIYLIWYAAEEGDRIGSKAVVADFKKRNIPIDAVMQFDMTGYAKNNDPTVWVSDNGTYRHTDKDLTAYALKLIEAYVKRPAKITVLSDESDHWSWAAAGYKTVFPMESDCHASSECPRREHTNKDTMDKLSLSHMTDYLKLAIAFAVELAEPVNS